jgi:predicted HAD superfamily Cof-like phosphohydrolase
MTEQIEQVREFYTAFKQPIGEGMDYDRKILKDKILREEVVELSDATFNNDNIEALDAVVDCMYILIGTAVELGIDHLIPAAFSEVHRSNMTKLDANGNALFRADGKIIKSELYEKPNLKKLFV